MNIPGQNLRVHRIVLSCSCARRTRALYVVLYQGTQVLTAEEEDSGLNGLYGDKGMWGWMAFC